MTDLLGDLLFDSHPSPMWIYDRETLAFLAVNEAALATYGYSRAEFAAMTLDDIRPPEDVPKLRASLTRPGSALGVIPGDWRHIRKSGVFPVEIRASRIEFAGRPAALIVVRDLSETTALRAENQALAAREAANATLRRIAGRTARLGGWRVDLIDRRCLWSDETAAIHEEPPGTSPSVDEGIAYYAPEWRDRITALFTACAERGEPYDEVLEILTARGRRVWVRTIGEAERAADGAIVAVRGAFQDISELMAARAEAERTAERLRHTVSSINEGLLTLDHHWRITSINPEAARLVRREAAELIGAPILDAFPEIVGTVVEAAYRSVSETREKSACQYFWPPHGVWFDINVYPSVEGMTVVYRDITTQKEAEGLLAWQAAMLDEAQDAIMVRGLDNRILYWNRNAERLYGFTAAEAIGADAADLLGADAAIFREADAAVRATGRWSGRIAKTCKNGSVVRLENRLSLIPAHGDRPQSILAIDADIADRLKLEARVEQVNRLEAVGQLTGGVAHDFNNLLTVILGAADLMAEALPPDASLREMLDISRNAAERGAELTRRLLAFARRQSLAPQPTDLARRVADMTPLIKRTLGAEIDLEVVRGGGLWPAEVDPGEFENALLNLCLNARDAMEADGRGRLTIETANTVLDEAYCAGVEDCKPGRYVMVGVSDTGEGMAPEAVARAFEPFFTTKAVSKGSGLGLSMVWGFVKQSGGHVKIYSEPGEGTTVRLYLPRAQSAARSLLGDPAAAPPAIGGSEMVLLVEDDAMVRAQAATLLRKLGYGVIEACDGPRALALVRGGAAFDVLFTDMMMPGGMNGRELAEAVVALRPGAAVLFTTGYADSAVAHQGRLDPDAPLLSKPYRRHELASRLRLALTRAQARAG